MNETNRRRIVMISTHGYVAAQPQFGRPDTGGQVVYVLEVSRCLARMGWEVEVWTRRFERQPSLEETADGVRIVRFPCGGGDFIPKETLCDFIPEWVRRAKRRFAEFADDVLFIDSHYWDAGLAGDVLAQEFGAPHVHTPHSLGAWKRDSMPGAPAEKERRYNFHRRIREERRIYEQCDLLVATTPQQREILLDAEYGAPDSKIHIVPPGYDDSRFYAASTSTRRLVKRELGLEGRIVLGLGRMAHNKGFDLLVRAMAPVVERIPDARLVIAAGSENPTDDERTQLRALEAEARRIGIADRLMLLGYIPDDRLRSYYLAADVFALCSRYEPFGMTAVEAMACGTPTILTTEGGLAKQVVWGAEALYADPNDTESYGHAIHRVLAYPEIAERLSENGARKARSEFTWTSVAQSLLSAVSEQPLPQSAPAARLAGEGA